MPLRLLILFSIHLACISISTAAPVWWKTNSDGIEAYSNASKSMTKNIIKEFHDARQTLKQIFPNIVANDQLPIRMVICRDQATIKTFSELYDGKPKTMGGVFLSDFEGPIIVISISSDYEYTRATIFHEYIHYITTSPHYRLPTWLNEGIADLFATIRTNQKGNAVVGETSPYRLSSLQHVKLIPFERFFRISRTSPEYNSSRHGRGTFYAQSWLLLHYIQFGENDFPVNSLVKIINHAIDKKSFNEEAIQEILGVSFKELNKQLKRYSTRGRFNRYVYALDDSASEQEIELTQASEGEVDLIIGALLLSFRSPSDALPRLIQASEKLPDSPQVAAYYAYHAIKQEQFEFADSHFERAIKNDCQSAFTYLNYAYTKLRLANPKSTLAENTLTKEETVEILKLVFKARSLAGGFSERLYHIVGQTWLCSSVKPNDNHMKILVEGLQQYPEDDRIAFYLAVYLQRKQEYDNALLLLDQHNMAELSFQSQKNFKWLKELIEQERPQ